MGWLTDLHGKVVGLDTTDFRLRAAKVLQVLVLDELSA